MSGDGQRAGPDRGLPSLQGGWELVEFDYVSIWVPREPDALLDDADVQERNRFNDTMPYWAWIWDSAPTMMRTLVDRGVSGRILEVGAGLGLVGLSVAKAVGETAETTLALSDYDPLACEALRVNARMNGFDGALIWEFDWRELESAPAGIFDAIIGCDVMYEGQAHEPLLDVLERYLDAGGTAYLADPGRSRLPQFQRRAEARGWAVGLENAAGQHAEPQAGEYRLLTLRR